MMAQTLLQQNINLRSAFDSSIIECSEFTQTGYKTKTPRHRIPNTGRRPLLSATDGLKSNPINTRVPRHVFFIHLEIYLPD